MMAKKGEKLKNTGKIGLLTSLRGGFLHGFDAFSGDLDFP
jgi:hypothetical protein